MIVLFFSFNYLINNSNSYFNNCNTCALEDDHVLEYLYSSIFFSNENSHFLL